MENEDHILKSWSANSAQWIHAIEHEEIESRKLQTNRAIVNVLVKYRPEPLLDLGCGEGWLTRELNEKGIETRGIDGTKDLIEYARKKGNGKFDVFSYADINTGTGLPGEPFGGIVINFGLFSDQGTEDLLEVLKAKLESPGLLFIQTIHPYSKINNKGYYSHWEENSWSGLNARFTDPHPWYFRTFSDWIMLFGKLNYKIKEVLEPVHPATHMPLSVIFVLET